MEYTYKDIIIDPEDERVKVGAYYFFGDGSKEVLMKANEGESEKLRSIQHDSNLPFDNGSLYWTCMIRDKEEKKKHVKLYDFSDPDTRRSLLGEPVRSKNDNKYLQDAIITGFTVEMESEDGEVWRCWLNGQDSFTAEEMFGYFEWHTGDPFCEEFR